jgi:hypothetical protein
MKLVGERRALAAAVLGFYALLYAAFALSGFAGAFEASMLALASCYGLAFFGLVAGYFWARWFAIGMGLFGVIQGALGWWQVGPEPIVLFMGGTHLFSTLILWGSAMAGPFEGKPEWREKFHMDEHAVKRLGTSVMRAGFSLPLVLLYAFAPKQDTASMVAALAAAGLAVGGLRGMIQMKTWGVLALGGAAAVLATSATVHAAEGGAAIAPVLGSILLFAAVAPFAMPIATALFSVRDRRLSA